MDACGDGPALRPQLGRPQPGQEGLDEADVRKRGAGEVLGILFPETEAGSRQEGRHRHAPFRRPQAHHRRSRSPDREGVHAVRARQPDEEDCGAHPTLDRLNEKQKAGGNKKQKRLRRGGHFLFLTLFSVSRILSMVLTAGLRSSYSRATSSESRSSPRVSWVRSFEPMLNPSNILAKSSARMTLEGISHIT